MINPLMLSGEISQLNEYIWFAGQSNSAGRAESVDLTGSLSYLASPLVVNGNTAYIRNYATNPTTYETLEAGVNTSDVAGRYGSELKFAYDYLVNKNRDLHILKMAVGGEPISSFADNTTYYNYIVNQTNAIKAADPLARFQTLVWIQGESDGGNTGYADKLRNLISRFRRDISPNLRVVIVQMIDCQTGVADLSALQNEQLEVSNDDTRNILIPKGVSDTCRDTLHFSDNKYFEISDELTNLV
jgi:hypothetical protein